MATSDISRRSDDETLIHHCLAGDESAFGFLVHKYKELVYAYAFQKVSNYADAEDITQEVFIRSYRNLGKLRYPHNFRSWLYTIGANECKRHLAKRLRRQEREFSLDDAPEEALGCESDFSQKTADWQIDLEEAMENLPEGNRIAVSMFYMSDCSLKEISDYLGVSVNTVKSKLFRARQQLGNMLERYGNALSENKLRGGFVMQIMEQLHRIPRPTIPPAWQRSMPRHIPITIATALCILLGVLGSLVGGWWIAVPAASFGAVACCVVSGLAQLRTPLRVWLYLFTAPAFIAWKLPLLARVMLRKADTAWRRTPRDGEL